MENKGEREGRSKQPGGGYCGENRRERSGEGEQREKKKSPGEGFGRRAPWLSIPSHTQPLPPLTLKGGGAFTVRTLGPRILNVTQGHHSLPGSSVLGILQARILEWVATPFSRGSSRPRDQTEVSRIAGGFFTV